MEGISRRELARRAGISESAVRRHVDSGALAAAVRRDGSLDPRLAMEALSGVITRGKRTPVALTTAKTRRLRVQASKLADEVADLRRSTIPPDVADAIFGEQTTFIAGVLQRIPDAAAKAAGQPAAVAVKLLLDSVHAALEATAGEGPEDHEDLGGDEPGADFDALAPNSLMAARVNAQAEKLEIERGLARSKLRSVHELAAEFEEKLALCKSLLLAMPGRLAQAAEASTPEQLRTLVAAEIEGALAELRTLPAGVPDGGWNDWGY